MTPFSDLQKCRDWWLFRSQNGQVSGEPVTASQLRNWWPVFFLLPGRKHTFRVVTNDETITRSEAIEFCKVVLDGRFTIVSIDFSDINRGR